MKITTGFPAIYEINHSTNRNVDEFIEYFNANKILINNILAVNGAIIFRNCGIDSVDDFSFILDEIADNLKKYTGGNTPRTKIKSKIYTSTEYDKSETINQHNELSYSINYPKKIYFCCITPSNIGGETPIADCRDILKSMNPEIIQMFKEKGVKYIRNLHSGQGIGKSWQDTFETKNKKEVELLCSIDNSEFEWKSNGNLRITQNRPAIIEHPITNEEVWFNQIDIFHPSQLSKEIYETLLIYCNNNLFDFPIFGCFGDGSIISDKIINEIRDLINSKRIIYKWKKGDLLVLDNIHISHGRMPFNGERKVLVAME